MNFGLQSGLKLVPRRVEDYLELTNKSNWMFG